MGMFTKTEVVNIEEGFTVMIESTEIMPGVTLSVYDDEEGVLSIGGQDITFAWCDDAKAVFSDIDTAEPIELLAILTKKYSAVSRELEVVA